MAGEDSRTRCPPASRATLPAAGHAATLASTGSARTASGKSQTSDHRPAATDSLPGTDSIGIRGGSDSDSASIPHQASTVGLQRIGPGDQGQRGIQLCDRPTGALKEADLDSGPKQGPQP